MYTSAFVAGECVCPPGWVGARCGQRCPAGYFGQGCASACNCSGSAVGCHHQTGQCICESGWRGRPTPEAPSVPYFVSTYIHHCFLGSGLPGNGMYLSSSVNVCVLTDVLRSALLYDTNCEDSNVTVLYRTNEVQPSGKKDSKGEAFQFLYLRKKDDTDGDVPQRGSSSDFDKSILQFIGRQIARTGHEAYPTEEEISQVLVNNCMTLHLNGSRVDPDVILATTAEFISNLNLAKVNAFVASVDIKDDLLTGNSNMWEVSLEKGMVHLSYLFSGHVAKLQNITVSRY